jgi:hypothetical protein
LGCLVYIFCFVLRNTSVKAALVKSSQLLLVRNLLQFSFLKKIEEAFRPPHSPAPCRIVVDAIGEV